MIDLWWSEAERNQVLPLNNQPGPPRRPALATASATSTHPGSASCRRPWRRTCATAAFTVTRDRSTWRRIGSADGVVLTHGGAAGGYAMYVQDGALHWTDNLLGARITTVSAVEPLPAGAVHRRRRCSPRPAGSRAT